MIQQILGSVKKILKTSPNADHDITHTLRVRHLCLHISSREGGDREVLEASSLLHDIGRPEEMNNPSIDHAQAAADLAPGILQGAGFPEEKIPLVVYAIASHRFSAQIVPDSLEARILQDADRLDISGAVGTAMTFTYSGARGRQLYHLDDPLAQERKLDGSTYALDHILLKLMGLPQSMHTDTAREMALERNVFLMDFIEQFVHEITFNGGKDLE